MRTLNLVFAAGFIVNLWPIATNSVAHAGIHRAPIVLKGKDLRAVTRYPNELFKLYRTGPKGEAVQIPFQIDEINNIGDYVLDQGKEHNFATGNGLFDDQDELVFMGDDVGPAASPKTWPSGTPNVVFEVKFELSKKYDYPIQNTGSVFIGIHFDKPTNDINYKYVVFDPNAGVVSTSRYKYTFDRKNYLVVDSVDMVKPSQSGGQILTPMIRSSTFYLKADLKYFLTFEANHRSVESKLDAYKSGPVRTIVRVSFFYTFLKLNFEAGMYTEVSFFSNSVLLPAMMYNPIEGEKSLNRGSGFYYGFTLFDNPSIYDVQSNMPIYENPKKFLNMFRNSPKKEAKYWLNASRDDRMIYVEIEPSEKMLKDNIIPHLYMNSSDPEKLVQIDNAKPRELENSRVNIGLFYDATKFAKGEHLMSFRLFFENKKDLNQLHTFINLKDWNFNLNRL